NGDSIELTSTQCPWPGRRKTASRAFVPSAHRVGFRAAGRANRVAGLTLLIRSRPPHSSGRLELEFATVDGFGRHKRARNVQRRLVLPQPFTGDLPKKSVIGRQRAPAEPNEPATAPEVTRNGRPAAGATS